MSILEQRRVILKCSTCDVTFVPENANQSTCTNCTIRAEIEEKVRLRLAK
jgi:hypothetical protein